ncbi:MAG: Zn-responsive transcriptional regulator Zur [Algoriphagus marincola HL-49]|uniref:Zn-responsive transcriptional regulator Zur n=1 Tax=Algoriphagus marincola HL-49 TaxID=1305737 RepID=A0A0P7YUC9_9BACT|nr:MAG: Zn-responsive transcriptional regulator Zur [Algoriphagus marincola HL-49]
MVNPHTILKSHKLRITDCRLDIIQEFLDRQVALAHSDLEEKLKSNFDRVTIYRTLSTFLEQDIIHKVLDDSGATKYALCSHEDEHDHDHEHVHFKCEICGDTSCLEDISLPGVKLPKGYKKREMSLLVTGICPKCS